MATGVRITGRTNRQQEQDYSQCVDFSEYLSEEAKKDINHLRLEYAFKDNTGRIYCRGKFNKTLKTERVFTSNEKELSLYVYTGQWNTEVEVHHPIDETSDTDETDDTDESALPVKAAASAAPAQQTATEHTDAASSENTNHKLEFHFEDSERELIPNLSYQVATDAGKTSGVSDSNGIGRLELAGKTEFKLYVVRDNKTTEMLHDGIMPSANTGINIISKALKVPIKTELHNNSGAGSLPPKKHGKREVQYGRNENLHPEAKLKKEKNERPMKEIVEKGVNYIYSIYEDISAAMRNGGLWCGEFLSWGKNGPGKEVEIPPPTKDDGKAINVQMTEEDQKRLEALMHFSMRQVNWLYTSRGSSGAMKDLKDKNWKPDEHSKKPDNPAEKCLTYVKVALNIAGITNILATSGNGHAKDAAREFLFPEGFKDITEQCYSDPYVALPGDVIVYKKIGYTNIEKKLLKTIEEYEKAEKVGKKLKGKKPKKPIDPKNHPGHIEIRTYDGFVSDYYKNTPVNYFSGGYEVTGIYRKVYDEKAGKRQDAFLKMLRILETEETWNALNYPIDGKKRFSDMSKHPWLDRDTDIIPTGRSTAAGAYQITRKTYNGVRQRPYYVHGIKFDPNSQTHMAIRILQGRRQERAVTTALTLIRQGKIEEAINTTLLYEEWVSLPGGEGQRVKSMQAFIEQWRKYT